MEITIREQVDAIEEEMKAFRRAIHKNPEISEQEFATCELIANKLKEIGVEVQTFTDKTGVIGLIKGGNPGKTIALRADIDALPLQEATDLEFSSKK